MKTESMRCRLGVHKWVLRGDEVTVAAYVSGQYGSFCHRCGKKGLGEAPAVGPSQMAMAALTHSMGLTEAESQHVWDSLKYGHEATTTAEYLRQVETASQKARVARDRAHMIAKREADGNVSY